MKSQTKKLSFVGLCYDLLCYSQRSTLKSNKKLLLKITHANTFNSE